MRIATKTYTLLLASLTVGLCASCPSAFANGSGGAAAPSAAPTASTPATSVHTTGIATWFGPGFYGKQTACGQTLTPGVVGVANRTLPCGTLIKVGYHGHTLTVPVLDGRPYARPAR